ncbi:MAG: phage major capsid protein [Alphaproteobacteria bacterium]|nr:phage major capsid protein [Alphaproteobacteria bacterium]
MLTPELHSDAQSIVDPKQFIKFLKGNPDHSEKIDMPMSYVNSLANKIKTLSPIKSLSKVSYISGDRLDVVIDSENSEDSGWVTDEVIKFEDISSVSKVSIHLHQLFTKPRVTHSLLEDESSSVEDFIQEKITTHMAALENKAFLYGDGLSQPKGILSYDISTEGPKNRSIEGVIGGSPGKIKTEKLFELMEKLNSKYLGGASWIMSRNVASYIRTLKDETNGKFLWQNSIAHGIPDTLLGYPVVICDDMSKITEAKAVVLFANLYEGYHIAEKPNISILKDPYNAKPFIEFYATKRVGGDIVNFNAIKALVLK